MNKLECIVCGYIYGSNKGDPYFGVEPNTKFEDVPNNWVCLVYGVNKNQFKILKK